VALGAVRVKCIQAKHSFRRAYLSGPDELNENPHVRTLIVGHEPHARAVLLAVCEADDNIDDVTVADCGATAIKMIGASCPELLFIDAELKDMTGFDVLRGLDSDERPATIVVASDDRYAAEARSLAAIDYLTKPISTERVASALERACSSIRRVLHRAAAKRVPAVERADDPYAGEQPIKSGDRLTGERGKRIYFFSPIDIDYIEADSNYVMIHVGSERYIKRDSLTRLSAVLESIGFVRISRDVLLNMQRVSFAEREDGGVVAFVLESGGRLLSSTRFRMNYGARLRIAFTNGTRRKSHSR
jgi:two-component system LytT family response regulator